MPPTCLVSVAIAACMLAAWVSQARGADDTAALRHLIDREVAAGWQQQNLTPADDASDASFLRRVYLDLVGVVPNHDQVEAFLLDSDPQKRENVIDRLLDDPRYAAAQAIVWDQVLFGRDPPGGDGIRKRDPFVSFLRESFASGKGYDQIVRELLLAEGNAAEQGAPLFLAQFRDKPEDATVAVTRLFLGIRLDCARCHDHPTEKWTQREFFAMAAFFSRIKVTDQGKAGAFTKYVIGEVETGDILLGWISALAISPDEKTLAVAERIPLDGDKFRALSIRNLADGKLVTNLMPAFEKKEHEFASADFSPDGSVVAVAQGDDEVQSGRAYLLRTSDGRRAAETKGTHLNGLRCVRFTADGKHLLTSGRDTIIRIWKSSDGSAVKELGTARGGQFKDWMCAFTLSHDESLLAGADMAGAVHVWTLAG